MEHKTKVNKKQNKQQQKIIEHIFILFCISPPNSSSWHNLLHTWGHTSLQLFYIHPINHFLPYSNMFSSSLFFFLSQWQKANYLNRKICITFTSCRCTTKKSQWTSQHYYQSTVTKGYNSTRLWSSKRGKMFYRYHFLGCSDMLKAEYKKGLQNI